jgi:hypothetical protein
VLHLGSPKLLLVSPNLLYFLAEMGSYLPPLVISTLSLKMLDFSGEITFLPRLELISASLGAHHLHQRWAPCQSSNQTSLFIDRA